jgi:hypothetical protein
MIYFGIALFCTLIFIVQFILSFFLGDLDLDSEIDVDGDGVSDFNWSDILSFKGLIHFGIGFGWTMWFNQDMSNKFLAAIIAIGVGLIFVFALWSVYLLARKLENPNVQEKGEDLVGREVKIYLVLNEKRYKAYIMRNQRRQLIEVESRNNRTYETGDSTVVKEYKNGIYLI